MNSSAFVGREASLQSCRCPIYEIVRARRQRAIVAGQNDLRTIGDCQLNRVEQADGLKDSIKFVVAVRPHAAYAQAQVDLGEGWKCHSCHRHAKQWYQKLRRKGRKGFREVTQRKTSALLCESLRVLCVKSFS